MIFVLALLAFGSMVLALMISWQVKNVSPDFISVSRYNLLVLPLILMANIALGAAFIRGNEMVKSLPLLSAMQTFMYYIFLLTFSVLIVGEKISVGRALGGCSLMAAGVWLLKK